MNIFQDTNIPNQLRSLKNKGRSNEEELLAEAKRILNNDLLSEEKILQNLGHYTRSFDVIDEEDVNRDSVYEMADIKRVATIYRLKFLDSKYYKEEIPYEAILKINEMNRRYRKELKDFRILAPHASFLEKDTFGSASLFVMTNHHNYYLIHSWGRPLSWKRRYKFWPLRSFETLAISLILFTALVTLSLPTAFITLDSHATYWCGYRAAAFFHLLIFHSGVTIYFTFAFALNFSSSIWNKIKDFG